MRRISRHKLTTRETIFAMFDRLVTGEHYEKTTGKHLGDLDAAISAWIIFCEQHIKELES